MAIIYHGKKLSLYIVAKFLLGYGRMVKRVHKTWCDDLEEILKIRKRVLLLKFRGAFKTTVYSVSFPIWYLMNDWVNHEGRFTKRILIASATNELAMQIMGEIGQHLTNNEQITQFFGYNPINRSNLQEIWLSPREIHKEPNIKAKGALSAIASEHYDLIIADDIVNSDDRESETTRNKKIRWYQDLISILEPGGELIVVGTRWHSGDLYGFLMEQNEKLPSKSKYHVEIESAIDKDGNPTVPEILNLDELQRLKIEKGIIEFASQYENKILPSETQLFKLESMQFYDESEEDLGHFVNYAYIDPALGSLNKNKGDYIVILVGAVKNGVLFVRDAYFTNTTTPDEALKKAVLYKELYGYIKIGIESNGFQTLYSKAAKEENLPVMEVKNTKNKAIRIEGIQPYIISGKIKFRKDWENVYPILIMQMIEYPAGIHDDGPDALEGLMSMSFKSKIGSLNVGDLVRSVRRNG